MPKAEGAIRQRVLDNLFEVALLLSGRMQTGLADRGLTLARARVLWQLARHGEINHRQLAHALGVTPRNVTGLVDRLEHDGFVTRRPHPLDRRAISVALTARGAQLADELRRDERALADELLGDVDPPLLDELMERLTELSTHLRREG